MKRTIALLTFALASLAQPTALPAQVPVAVAGAELAIPFGAVTGQIAATNDVFIFVGDERKDASFAIRRGNIRNVSVAGDVLTIETVEAVNGGTSFNFKITEGEASKMAEWARGNAPTSMPAGAASAALAASAAPATGAAGRGAPRAGDSGPKFTYQAQQKRRMGSNSTGKLEIYEDQIRYDSLDNVDRSRQWQLQEIKEIKRKNPYKVEVNPFVGSKETFDLIGGGMSSADFQEIRAMISKQRRP
jgi:hypothetical protein